MNTGKLLGITLLLILSGQALFAESLVLDKDSCLNLALKNNIDLLNEAVSLESARRAFKNSGNKYCPDITTALQVSDSLSLSGEGLANSSRLYPQLTVSYRLSPGLKESIEQLSLSVESSEISYETLRLNLLHNVEIEFYYLLTSRGNLEIQEKNIELAERLYEQTRIKFRNGLVSNLEVLQAEVNAANLVPSFSSQKSAYENRLREFLLVLGIDPLTEVELTGELELDYPELDGGRLVSRYIENRSDVRAQRKQIDILKNLFAAAGASASLPSVSLSASLSDIIANFHTAEGWAAYSPGADLSLSLAVSLGIDDYFPGSALQSRGSRSAGFRRSGGAQARTDNPESPARDNQPRGFSEH